MVALNLIVMVASMLASGNVAVDSGTNSSSQYRVEFEDDQVRVLRVSLRAGEQTAVEDHPDAVLIYLTADLDGRVPDAVATWRPMGTYGLQNRARTSFEALLVELTAPASGAPASIEPEAMPATYSFASFSPEYPFYEPDAHRANSLVENARVAVTWHRLVPLVQTESDHFHLRDTVFIYLRGGEMNGSTGQLGVHRARRGEFHVLPSHVLHALGNVGNDPIEFVMIAPK